MARRKWKGPDKLKTFLVPVGAIELDPENARVHDDRNVETVKQSFTTNGQVQLLVVYKGEVQAGNARLRAARELSWTHVAILDVSDHFESKDQARAFALVDNKSSDLGTFDFERVANQLRAIKAQWLPMTGFADYEIEPLMAPQFVPKKPSDDNGSVGDYSASESFSCTQDQAETIRRAISKVRLDEEDDSIPEGRALELICGDFLA